MQEDFIFPPVKQPGQLIHYAAIVGLLFTGIFGLTQAFQASIGPAFLFYLLLSLLSFVLTSLLIYRAYSLRTAFYQLQRDGVVLRWGLRWEEIPMNAIQWVHPTDELNVRLPLPWLRWPGAVLGVRHLSGAGSVEYLASTSRNLVAVATQERIFVVSPADTQSFLHTYQRLTEMGSISPFEARSIHPATFLRRVWSSPAARILLLSGALLSLALLAGVSLAIPTRPQIPLGFHPDGTPGDLVPSARLLLLPVLNTLIFLTDLLGGMFFFRRQESQLLSYLLWAGGALTPLLFTLGVVFILRAA